MGGISEQRSKYSNHWLTFVTSTSDLSNWPSVFSTKTLSCSSLISLYLSRNLTSRIFDSRWARCLPMQVLGPALKVDSTICRISVSWQRGSSRRSGLNSKGQSKQRESKKLALMRQLRPVPFLTGMSPISTSSVAVRLRMKGMELSSLPASLTTSSAYLSSLIWAAVTGSLGLVCSLIYLLSFWSTWGCWKRQNRVDMVRAAVESCPPIVKMYISSARVSSRLGASPNWSIRSPIIVWGLDSSSCLFLLLFFSSTIFPTSSLSLPLTAALILLNLLQSALKFMPVADAPKTMTNGWKQSRIDRVLISLMAASRGIPSMVSSSRSVPRNRDTTILPKVLLRSFSRSSLNFVSSPFYICTLFSSFSVMSPQILAMLGTWLMRKLWLNTLDISLRLHFHCFPSSNIMPLGVVELTSPKNLVSFCTVIRDCELVRDWASLGQMMPSSILLEMLLRTTSQPGVRALIINNEASSITHIFTIAVCIGPSLFLQLCLTLFPTETLTRGQQAHLALVLLHFLGRSFQQVVDEVLLQVGEGQFDGHGRNEAEGQTHDQHGAVDHQSLDGVVHDVEVAGAVELYHDEEVDQVGAEGDTSDEGEEPVGEDEVEEGTPDSEGRGENGEDESEDEDGLGEGVVHGVEGLLPVVAGLEGAGDESHEGHEGDTRPLDAPSEPHTGLARCLHHREEICSGSGSLFLLLIACLSQQLLLNDMQNMPKTNPSRQGLHLPQGFQYTSRKQSSWLESVRAEVSEKIRTFLFRVYTNTNTIDATASNPLSPTATFGYDLQTMSRSSPAMKSWKSTCRYQPHPKHMPVYAETMLEQKNISFHIQRQASGPAFWVYQVGPLPVCMKRERQNSMAMMQAGQILNALWGTARRYLGRELCSLSMMKARKKPPSQKKTSTDSMPASTKRQQGLLAMSAMLPKLMTPAVKQKKQVCPKTTHIIASALTPSMMLRLSFWRILKWDMLRFRSKDSISKLLDFLSLLWLRLRVEKRVRRRKLLKSMMVRQEVQSKGVSQFQVSDLTSQMQRGDPALTRVSLRYVPMYESGHALGMHSPVQMPVSVPLDASSTSEYLRAGWSRQSWQCPRWKKERPELCSTPQRCWYKLDVQFICVIKCHTHNDHRLTKTEENCHIEDAISIVQGRKYLSLGKNVGDFP